MNQPKKSMQNQEWTQTQQSAKCKEIPVSLHCWQGDDVTGFDHDGPLTGGIQTTGNYPGKARTPEELLADMDKAMSLMPGKKKINVHACYAIFED